MNFPILLTDFQSYKLLPSITQERLEKIFIQFLAVAACVQQQPKNQQEANKILLDIKKEVAQYGVKKTAIKQRQITVLPKMYAEKEVNLQKMVLPKTYPNLQTNTKGLAVNKRMDFYQKMVLKVLEKWYENELEIPNEIIHVTCSGYVSPSAVQVLIATKSWTNTVPSNCYQSDCYAAFPAVRMAQGSLALAALSNKITTTKPQKIDIVHTEMLSLHTDISTVTVENIVKMTLFGDGFIKYSAVPVSTNKKGLKVLAIHEAIIPSSSDQMKWQVAPYHFEMTLSRYVPLYIGEAIMPFIQHLFAQLDLNFEAEKNTLVCAIHPGGPKILTFIQDRLQLSDEQMKYSWQVLAENGNMSSATLPHIWQLLLNDDAIKKGSRILSLAFGPGLTACGMIMEKC